MMVSLQKWLAHFYCKRRNMNCKVKHLETWINEIITSTVLIRLRFKGNRFKLDIAVFAWRVTWNYAYSPFNVWIVGKNIFYKEDTSKNASTQNLIW